MAISVFKTSGGNSNTGINYGKNIISAYRYNQPGGSGNVNLGAYDEEYFTFDGSGTFTCKKPCNVKIFAVAGAVPGNSNASFTIYKNDSSIASSGSAGGWRLIESNMTVDSTLRMKAYSERESASAVLNVYLNK